MKCKQIKENNENCMANAMRGSNFCYLHNPEIDDDEKQFHQSRGGQANKHTLQAPLEPVRVKTTSDVVVLLEDTINKVRSGELDLKTANCIGYLSGHITKALEIADIEKRIEVIERAVLKK